MTSSERIADYNPATFEDDQHSLDLSATSTPSSPPRASSRKLTDDLRQSERAGRSKRTPSTNGDHDADERRLADCLPARHAGQRQPPAAAR